MANGRSRGWLFCSRCWNVVVIVGLAGACVFPHGGTARGRDHVLRQERLRAESGTLSCRQPAEVCLRAERQDAGGQGAGCGARLDVSKEAIMRWSIAPVPARSSAPTCTARSARITRRSSSRRTSARSCARSPPRTPPARSTARAAKQFARQMMEQMQKALAERGIVVENVLLRDIVLPRRCATRLKRAAGRPGGPADELRAAARAPGGRAQAHRGAGRRRLQRIVAQGLNQQLLEWKGIEATMEIAKSPNTKVVLVGNPKTGCRSSFRASSVRGDERLQHIPAFHRGEGIARLVERVGDAISRATAPRRRGARRSASPVSE